MQEDFGKKKNKILISPFCLGSEVNPRLLVVADMLKGWRSWSGEDVFIGLAINHGGLWAFKKVKTKIKPREFLFRQKESLERNLNDLVKKLDLSFSSHPVFFLDDNYKNIVFKVFLELFEQGCLNRKSIIAPWCPNCLTILDSDRKREKRKKTVEANEILVTVKGTETKLPVLFTEPELLGAAVGLAIHPSDKTLEPFLGRIARLPLYGREVKILKTPHRTSAGTIRPIMPAYDPNDFLLAQENYLSVIDVMDSNGRMNSSASRYAELSREEARKRILSDLEGSGNLGEVKDVSVERAVCEICGTSLTLRFSSQWFVDLSGENKDKVILDLAKTIKPESFLNSITSEASRTKWCVSRQSDWGCRLPVWLCASCDQFVVSKEKPSSCTECGGEKYELLKDKLSSGFLAALWPLVSECWDKEKEEEDLCFADTILFGGKESELAYLSINMIRKIAPEALPKWMIGIKNSKQHPVPEDSNPDVLRICYLMNAQVEECYSEVLLLLEKLEEYISDAVLIVEGQSDAVSTVGEQKTESGDLPVLEEWICNSMIRAFNLLLSSFKDSNISYAGDILVRQVIRPLVEIYAPRLKGRSEGVALHVLNEFCTWILPYLYLFAPGVASNIAEKLSGKISSLDIKRCRKISEAPYDIKLINRVDRIFRLQKFLKKRPELLSKTFLTGPSPDLTILRKEAEVFGCDEIMEAMNRTLPVSIDYKGRLFGRLVLLEPAEEGNMPEIIDKLRQRSKNSRTKNNIRKGSDGVAEFIKELKRYMGPEKTEA